MLTYELTGELRTATGKAVSKKLRRDSQVPCVLNTAQGPLHFTAHVNDLMKAIKTPNTYLVALSLGGKTYNAVLKDRQFDPVFDNLLHVDFNSVLEDKPVEVSLPVLLTGVAEGVQSGGKLVQKTRRLKVSGFAKDLPQSISVDVTNLKLGRSMKVREVNFDKFKVLTNGDVPLATVEIPRALRTDRRG